MSTEKTYNRSFDPRKDRNIAEEPYIAWELKEAAEKIGKGLYTDVLLTIQNQLGLSNKELADLLLISPRTLDRRKKEKTLPSDESERSYRIARLIEQAILVFGDVQKASEWMMSSNYALGGRKPFDLMKTEPGVRLVERQLGQIEYGINI